MVEQSTGCTHQQCSTGNASEARETSLALMLVLVILLSHKARLSWDHCSLFLDIPIICHEGSPCPLTVLRRPLRHPASLCQTRSLDCPQVRIFCASLAPSLLPCISLSWRDTFSIVSGLFLKLKVSKPNQLSTYPPNGIL